MNASMKLHHLPVHHLQLLQHNLLFWNSARKWHHYFVDEAAEAELYVAGHVGLYVVHQSAAQGLRFCTKT